MALPGPTSSHRPQGPHPTAPQPPFTFGGTAPTLFPLHPSSPRRQHPANPPGGVLGSPICHRPPYARGLRCGGSGVGDMVWVVGMVLGGTGGAGGGQEVLGGTGGVEVAPLRTTGPLAWSCPRFAL